MSELECSISLGVVTQPMQLPCDRQVCATCLIEWLHLTAACLECNPAPNKLIQHDVMCGVGHARVALKPLTMTHIVAVLLEYK